MTTNELFWASVFGAACGMAGMTALLGFLAWAWKRAGIWRMNRAIRKACPWGPGTVPPPPPPTREELLQAVQAMGTPIRGAAAGVSAAYEGPARKVGEVVLPRFPFPGVIKVVTLDNGVEGFAVNADWSENAVCPCCWQPKKPRADVFGVLREQEDGIPRSPWPRPIVTPVGGIPVNPNAKPPEPPAGPGGGAPDREDLPPLSNAP